MNSGQIAGQVAMILCALIKAKGSDLVITDKELQTVSSKNMTIQVKRNMENNAFVISLTESSKIVPVPAHLMPRGTTLKL